MAKKMIMRKVLSLFFVFVILSSAVPFSVLASDSSDDVVGDVLNSLSEDDTHEGVAVNGFDDATTGVAYVLSDGNIRDSASSSLSGVITHDRIVASGSADVVSAWSSTDQSITVLVKYPDDSTVTPDTIPILYNNSWNEVKRADTNDSTIYTFTDLDVGTYHVEAYKDNMFIGSGNTDVAAGECEFVTITTLYKRNLEANGYYKDGSSPIEDATVIVYSWDGHNDTGDYEYRGTTNSQGKVTFSSWPTSISGEKYKLEALHNGYSKTVEPVYVDNDSGSSYSIILTKPALHSFKVIVKNIVGNSLPLSGGTIDVVLYDNEYKPIETKSKTYSGGESSVQVEFDNIADNDYYIEVYNTANTGLKLREFWGADEITVSGSTIKDFVRHTQWVSDIKINGESPYGNEIRVNTGEKVHVVITVKNDEGSSKKLKVRLILDRDKSSSYDFDETHGLVNVHKNGYDYFGYDFSPSQAGTYYFYCVVYGDYNNKYTIVDQHDWCEAIKVVCVNPEIELTPSSHDYGTVLTGVCTVPFSLFTLKNVGGGTAKGNVYLTGSHKDQFKITFGGGSFSLDAVEARIIGVVLCPTSAGYKSATLYADGSNCNNDQSHLSGTGVKTPPPYFTIYTQSTIIHNEATLGDVITLDASSISGTGYTWKIYDPPARSFGPSDDKNGRIVRYWLTYLGEVRIDLTVLNNNGEKLLYSRTIEVKPPPYSKDQRINFRIVEYEDMLIDYNYHIVRYEAEVILLENETIIVSEYSNNNKGINANITQILPAWKGTEEEIIQWLAGQCIQKALIKVIEISTGATLSPFRAILIPIDIANAIDKWKQGDLVLVQSTNPYETTYYMYIPIKKAIFKGTLLPTPTKESEDWIKVEVINNITKKVESDGKITFEDVNPAQIALVNEDIGLQKFWQYRYEKEIKQGFSKVEFMYEPEYHQEPSNAITPPYAEISVIAKIKFLVVGDYGNYWYLRDDIPLKDIPVYIDDEPEPYGKTDRYGNLKIYIGEHWISPGIHTIKVGNDTIFESKTRKLDLEIEKIFELFEIDLDEIDQSKYDNILYAIIYGVEAYYPFGKSIEYYLNNTGKTLKAEYRYGTGYSGDEEGFQKIANLIVHVGDKYWYYRPSDIKNNKGEIIIENEEFKIVRFPLIKEYPGYLFTITTEKNVKKSNAMEHAVDYFLNNLDSMYSPVHEPKLCTNTIGMEFVLIPAGEFEMGSPPDEEGRYENEGPVHHVNIEKAFYMGRYEVTQKQWREIMGDNPSYFKGDNLPVEQVSWDDVQEFIKKLNEKEGTNKYRLPSEAEWEYACRAGTSTRYSFGDDDNYANLGDYAWYSDNSGSQTHLVGQKKANPWGLYDMYGNVWEWVQDCWHSDYNGAPADGSAWVVSCSGVVRVFRGGSWRDCTWLCRSAFRGHHVRCSLSHDLGFRLLQEV